ncbi:four-helix bundle copper-binding protein [Burkholderia contaminans]|uniref:four-helix bundle copper-binding protein n=1 Tax=Burkholderia contaminans TaxID=488447 RepID=UPI003464AE97
MAHQQYQSCISACDACATACDHCAAACLAESQVSQFMDCIKLDLDWGALRPRVGRDGPRLYTSQSDLIELRKHLRRCPAD